MENLIEEIGKYYQIFYNAKTDWHFFLGLNDYVEFIKSKKEIEPILDKLTKQRKAFEKSLIPTRKKNRLDANIRLDRMRDVENWGDLYRLELVSSIIALNKDYKTSNNQDLANLQKEMRCIEKDGHPYVGIVHTSRYKNRANYSSDKDENIEEFKRKKYEFYAERIHNYLIQKLQLKELPKPKGQQDKKDIILYLNNNGDFYKEPKSKFCYKMKQGSNRYILIIFLIKNKGYQQTDKIAEACGYNNTTTARNEIAKIRNNIKKFLNIKGSDLLEGRKDGGYRINPKYKITLRDE